MAGSGRAAMTQRLPSSPWTPLASPCQRLLGPSPFSGPQGCMVTPVFGHAGPVLLHLICWLRSCDFEALL